VSETPLVWDHLSDVRNRLLHADGLLFGTDFDGTLSPIEENPDTPEPTETNLRSLRALRDHPQVRPAVISGRGLADLRERVGIEGVDYVGNHGLELGIDGQRETHPDAEAAEPVIEEICRTLGDRLAEIDGTVVENKGVTATIHYRMVDREQVETVQTHIKEAVSDLGEDEVEIHDGKESLELRPAADWDKGTAMGQLLAHVDGWLPLYIGDDTTDEAAFEEIRPDGITVHVGDNHETAADYRVRTPAEAEVFIRWVVTDGLALLESTDDAA
jgi:trehalose 6-phosphate phosphatase